MRSAECDVRSAGVRGAGGGEAQVTAALASHTRNGRLHASGPHLFRGAAVAWNRRAILFVGDAGAAKTTLVVQMLAEGCRLLSPDVVCLDVDRQRVLPLHERMSDGREAHERPRWSRRFTRAASSAFTPLGAPAGERPQKDVAGSFPAAGAFSYELDECVPAVALYLKGLRDRPRLAPLAPVRAVFDLVDAHLGDARDRTALAIGIAGFFPRVDCFDVFVGPADLTARLVMRTIGDGRRGWRAKHARAAKGWRRS